MDSAAKNPSPLIASANFTLSCLIHFCVVAALGYFWLDADREAPLGAFMSGMMLFSAMAYFRTLLFGPSGWRFFFAGEVVALVLISSLFVYFEWTGAAESRLVYSVESSVDSIRNGYDRLLYWGSLLLMPLYVSGGLLTLSVVGHRYALGSASEDQGTT